MNSVWPFIINFYLPIAAFLFLVLVVIISPKFLIPGSPIELKGDVSVLGVKVPLRIWITKIWIVRCVLLFAALASLIYALTIDFTRFFPARFRMDVYFDYRGMERNLTVFSGEEASALDVATDWTNRVPSYDDAVKGSLSELWRKRDLTEMPAVTNITREGLHARGGTTFIVERVGLLAYRVKENNGHLDYEVDIPKEPRRGWRGSFELRETSNNHVRPDIWKLLKSPAVVIAPEFKQTFSDGGYNTPFDHVVTGVTKVTLLPFPAISDTLYLWRLPNGKTVPIAYGVYY